MKRYLPILLGIGLAACGGATRTVIRTVSTSASTPSTSTTPATASTATSTPTSATTATGASAGPCVAANLALSFIGQQGAAGHGVLGFSLKNTSSTSCHTFGFPGVLWLDRSGGALSTIPHHTTTDYFGHVPEERITLAPGGTASFRLGVTHGAVPGSVCTTAHGLQVIPPDDTARLRTTIPDGAYECRDTTVSPLAAGTAAYGP